MEDLRCSDLAEEDQVSEPSKCSPRIPAHWGANLRRPPWVIRSPLHMPHSSPTMILLRFVYSGGIAPPLCNAEGWVTARGAPLPLLMYCLLCVRSKRYSSCRWHNIRHPMVIISKARLLIGLTVSVRPSLQPAAWFHGGLAMRW